MLNAVEIGCGQLNCQEKVNKYIFLIKVSCTFEITGAALYTTCVEMCKIMSQLGIAVDGGKDSLSMAARVGSETIKAPGNYFY